MLCDVVKGNFPKEVGSRKPDHSRLAGLCAWREDKPPGDFEDPGEAMGSQAAATM